VTRLDPKRYPWHFPHLLLFAAIATVSYVLVARYAPLMGRSSLHAFAQTLILAFAFVLPPVAVARIKRKRVMALWVPHPQLGRDIAAGLVLGMLLAAMNGIAIVLSVGSQYAAQRSPLEYVTVQTGGLGNVSLMLLGVGIVSPLAEELLFRGVLYPTLRKRLPALPSMLLSAAAFSAAHLHHLRAQTFLLGLVSAILVEYTGSVVPAVLAHIGVNASFVLFLANGAVLARSVPLWALIVGFAMLNVLLFLLGKPLFGPLEGDEPTEADGENDDTASGNGDSSA
jgi:membrane protease YdiL (CAAX protease family)